MQTMMHIWLQMADNSGRFIKGYTYKDGKFGLVLTGNVNEGIHLDTAAGTMASNTTKLISQLLAQPGNNDAIPESQLAIIHKTIQDNTKLAVQLSFN